MLRGVLEHPEPYRGHAPATDLELIPDGGVAISSGVRFIVQRRGGAPVQAIEAFCWDVLGTRTSLG